VGLQHESEIVPRAVGLQHELIKRLPASNERHQSAAEHGWTPSEIYAVREDLEVLLQGSLSQGTLALATSPDG
jgi:hypothetical protein